MLEGSGGDDGRGGRSGGDGYCGVVSLFVWRPMLPVDGRNHTGIQQ